MNNFSWNRIKHLLLMQILDGSLLSMKKLTVLPSNLGIRLLLLSAVLALVGIFMGENNQFVLTICMIVSVAPFLFFVNDKNKAVNYLLIPASAKEKTIALFILITGGMIVLVAATSLMMIFLSELLNLAVGNDLFSCIAFFKKLTVIPFTLYLLILSILYLLSLSSNNWFLFFAKFFGWYILIFILGLIIISNIDIDVQNINTKMIINAILFCISLLFWVASYYRLKRCEV